MQNIHSILEGYGITIPEDKKEEFNSLVEKNYKTVAELNGVKTKLDNLTTERDALKSKYDEDIATRDEDLKKLQKQIEEAGTDAEKLKTTIAELDSLKQTYESDKQKYEDELMKQKYEFAVKEKANSLKFTSNAAKKSFINDVIATGLKMKDDTLLGFDDFVTKYKEEDAGVFVVENTEGNGDTTPPPSFSTKTDNKGTNSGTKKPESKPIPLVW